MRKLFLLILISCFISLSFFACGISGEPENNWPQWRGPDANGVAPSGNPPVTWSEQENIKWKSEIPGKGHATPIIWGDRIILLAAVPTEKKVEPEEPADQGEENQWMSPTSTDYIHRFAVICVNRQDGSIAWQTSVREELPYNAIHQFGSWASNSPVTDGEHIFAYFGSYGLYSLDMNGNIIWDRDLGRLEKVMNFGEGSSPVLYKDKLIIVRDHQGPSSIYVLDKRTGETIWESERDEISAWATPLVYEFEEHVQILTSATNRIRSYDLETGEIIWECSGMTRNVIPTPVFHDGIVYLASGFRGSALFAIDLSKATGDITDSDAILWKYDQNTPYTPSIIVNDGRIYFLKLNNGYLTCLDAADGREIYANQPLEGIKNIFTSPVAVDDRLYIAGMEGNTCVVKQGDSFKVLAENQLDDNFIASPVVIGNELFLRGYKYLYCLAGD